MSHSSSYTLESNTIRVKTGETLRKKGYKKASSIKKGDKITIGVKTPEDGNYTKVVTITGTKLVRDYHDEILFQFDNSDCYDEQASLPVNWLYKIES